MALRDLVQDNNETVALLHLKDLTRRTGTIHDAQALQLRIWPRIAIPNSTQSVAKVDTKKCTVLFEVTRKGRQPKNQQRLFKVLDENVKFMLGDWWSVSVKEGKKIIFEGPAREPAPAVSSFKGTDFAAGKIVPRQPWQFLPKTQPTSK